MPGRMAARGGKVYAVAVGNDATFRASSDPVLYAEISMQFELIEVPIQDRARLGRYKASTTWYRYSVHNYNQREILSYQWHPGVEVDFPHLHVESLEKCHIPTGRISIEEFIWLLVHGFDVKPKKEKEWEKNFETRTKHGPFSRSYPKFCGVGCLTY